MKPKFEYIDIGDLAKYGDKRYYIFAGGRGCGKSLAQLKYTREVTTLYDDIEACNRELAKIERRNNDRTN